MLHPSLSVREAALRSAVLLSIVAFAGFFAPCAFAQSAGSNSDVIGAALLESLRGFLYGWPGLLIATVLVLGAGYTYFIVDKKGYGLGMLVCALLFFYAIDGADQLRSIGAKTKSNIPLNR